MCDKKTSSIVHAQQASVERVAELMTTAEKELAAFYEAVFRQYGMKEARNAAQDWIDEFGTMDWPAAPFSRHSIRLTGRLLPGIKLEVTPGLVSINADSSNRAKRGPQDAKRVY